MVEGDTMFDVERMRRLEAEGQGRGFVIVRDLVYFTQIIVHRLRDYIGI